MPARPLDVALFDKGLITAVDIKDLPPEAASYSENIDGDAIGGINDQLVDGLDSFYSDYRNRKILINVAVWLVAKEISGKSKEEMEKMSEDCRKNEVY